MSRTGCCYDNAVAERFFWSVKQEWARDQESANPEVARLRLFRYIETFYNTERVHVALGYLSPHDFEQEYQLTLAS